MKLKLTDSIVFMSFSPNETQNTFRKILKNIKNSQYEKFHIFFNYFFFINHHSGFITQLKCRSNTEYCLSLIKIWEVIKKAATKNCSEKKIFLTHQTDILCSFQKSNFHHCHKNTVPKKQLWSTLSIHAIMLSTSPPSAILTLRQLASLLPRKKTDRSIYQFAIAIEITCDCIGN